MKNIESSILKILSEWISNRAYLLAIINNRKKAMYFFFRVSVPFYIIKIKNKNSFNRTHQIILATSMKIHQMWLQRGALRISLKLDFCDWFTRIARLTCHEVQLMVNQIFKYFSKFLSISMHSHCSFVSLLNSIALMMANYIFFLISTT